MQGPYVYYLYHQYGFGKGEIEWLFIAGFGSSMLFGTIVRSLADKQGRKRACITYCINYILNCMTKHSSQFKMLMLGLILGGITTSLLFSAFEFAEHNKVMGLTALGIPDHMLTSITNKEDEKYIYKALEKGDGDLKILFVTPEKISNSKRFMSKLEKCHHGGRLCLIAIDPFKGSVEIGFMVMLANIKRGDAIRQELGKLKKQTTA